MRGVMSDSRRDLGRRSFVGSVLAVLLLVSAAPGVRGEAPLSTTDLVRFLRAGISESTILHELQTRGFMEALDGLRESALREAGASETLVVAVRRVAPAEPPPAPVSVGRPAADPLTTAGPRGTGREPTFAIRTRTVRVPVSVLDKAGQPVLGLSREDFEVAEDGKKQAVTQFSSERRPLRIALALDISGSMTNKIRQVEEALRHFIDLLEPADEIMVITFNDRARVIQDFTSDRDLLARVLDRLEPFGATTLYDAVSLALQRVAKGPAESKAVVLVSDGVDTASAMTFEDLRELARRSEVPVFSIGLDSGPAPRNFSRPPGHRGPGGGGYGVPGGGHGGPGGGGGRGGWPGGGGGSPGGQGAPWGQGGYHHSREGFDARPLTELADDTGGRAEILKEIEHYTPGTDEAPGSALLKGAVETIAMILRHRYLLGYEPPDGKAAWRTIRVEVDRPSATARSRKGYYGGGA
jgi:VWFA-related protein